MENSPSVALVVISVGYSDVLQHTLASNAASADSEAQCFNDVIVVTTLEDKETQHHVHSLAAMIELTCRGHARPNLHLVLSNRCYDDEHAFNKGRMINDGLKAIPMPDWIVLTDADIFLNPATPSYIKSHTLNKDCLYYVSRLDVDIKQSPKSYMTERAESQGSPQVNQQPIGYFQLFNRHGASIRDTWPTAMSENFCSAGSVDTCFAERFSSHERVLIPELAVTHVRSEKFGANWNGRQPRRGWRQIGFITTSGISSFVSQDAWSRRLRLTDALHGDTIELQPGQRLSDVIQPFGAGLLFNGRDIDVCHIHVAGYFE